MPKFMEAYEAAVQAAGETLEGKADELGLNFDTKDEKDEKDEEVPMGAVTVLGGAAIMLSAATMLAF